VNLRPVQAMIAIAIMLCGPLLHAGDANTKKEVFFGTTHAHPSWSIDAFGLGNQKSGPEDGYRFARGEVTDHSAMMDTAQMMLEKGSALYSGTRLDIPDLVRD
jgi:hypothetical protein